MYAHPLEADAITDSNFREIASELFSCQCQYLSTYALDMAKDFGDDDTDYFSTALNATERLMEIVYDGNRENLVSFLFTPRDSEKDSATPFQNENLADMISAGGLCDELWKYEEIIYATEDLKGM